MFSSLDTGVPLPNPGTARVRETSRSSVSRSPLYPAILSVSPLEDSASPQFVLSKTNCLGPLPPDPGPSLLPTSSWHHVHVPVLPTRLETHRCPVLLILAPESLSETVPSGSASRLLSRTSHAPFIGALWSFPGLPVTFHTTPDSSGHVTTLVSNTY